MSVKFRVDVSIRKEKEVFKNLIYESLRSFKMFRNTKFIIVLNINKIYSASTTIKIKFEHMNSLLIHASFDG